MDEEELLQQYHGNNPFSFGSRREVKRFVNIDDGELKNVLQGGITCGAIDEPRKSSKAIDERVIINFRDKNVVIARFRDKNVYR